MPRKQQSDRRGKTRGKPAAKPRTKPARAGKAKPSARTKPSAGTKPSAAGRRTSSAAKATAKPAKRAMGRLAASAVAPPEVEIARLYELVCDVDGRMQDGLKLGACNDLANAHLAKHPEHDCDCFRQGTSDDAIARRFRARAADR
jgi:hypothetical protein